MHIKRNVIRVNQRFGPFYVVKFTANELLSLAYSEPLRRENDKLYGSQRIINEERRKSIKKYINSSECAFPNSIILAANFSKDGLGQIEESENIRWEICEEGSALYLTIPTPKPMAIIIDGQHRLMGFKDADSASKEMELICSVYLDLPSSMQAFLFATINSTQKAVDKSLAYELFGYDLVNEVAETWSPDKLAISICRKLNTDPQSPFYEHIKPGGIAEDSSLGEAKWKVSTSCVVDCILRLISTNPKDDKALLYKFGSKTRLRIKLKNERNDSSPLRELYLDCHDGIIFKIICNFFNAAKNVYKDSFESGTALVKTIGIQGLFDVLREYIKLNVNAGLKNIDFTEMSLEKIFEGSVSIDFSDDIFMKFSGVGRARIRDAVLVTAGLKPLSAITQGDFSKWLEDNTSS